MLFRTGMVSPAGAVGMSIDRMRAIRENAEQLATLYQSVRAAYGRRYSSPADREAWETACARFHAQYGVLYYPGGEASLQALREGKDEGIEIALDFLEVDPRFFRSGYLKEQLWTQLRRCRFTRKQQPRLERVALAYTHRPIGREFWYMCRAMAQLATPGFWTEVRAWSEQQEGTRVGTRSAYLALYAPGADPSGQLRGQAKAEAQRRMRQERSLGRPDW